MLLNVSVSWLRKKLRQQEIIESLPVISSKGFKTPQSLGKAIRKLDNNLPKLPTKQRAVINGLAKWLGLELSLKITHNHGQRINQRFTEENKKLITDFYVNTDVVYTMPGMHDEMTVWENGNKSKSRKYYLIMFLKEVYELFKQSSPDITVGFSKFASLRPANVLLLKDQHPDMCKCEIHENFFKIKGLGITYDEHFWPNILCDDSLDLTSPCWRGICFNCQLKNKFTIEKSDADTVFWKEWIKTETEHLWTDQKTRVCRWIKRRSFQQIFFFQRTCEKWIQSTAFTEDKKRSDCHVLQCDFTMAYSCDYQNEVQSALWSHKCINLFTAALYSKSQVCQPFLIITDRV